MASLEQLVDYRGALPDQLQSQDLAVEVEEGLDEALSFLSSCHVDTEPAPSRFPNSSPSSSSRRRSSTTLRSSKDGRSKKVNFASFLQWEFHSPNSSQSSGLTRLVPSSKSKPAKSILKPFKPSTLKSTPATNQSFPDMLGWIQKQLGRKDPGLRLDAYNSCLSSMQIPDLATDEANLAESASFLLREAYEDIHTSGNTRLSLAAFKFIIAIIRHLSLDGTCDEFEEISDLIETSISSIQQATASKALLHHQLLFLSLNFHGKNMTHDRANRIITCLRDIHKSIPGNGVRFYRLLIYRRLVDTMPVLMEDRLQDWLMINVYTSMMSIKPEIRQQAFELGATTALRLGPTVSKYVQETLARQVADADASDQKSFGDIILERLVQNLKHKDRNMALVVPRIFAVTVLLLNSSFKKYGQWQQFKRWLQLISQCLSSPDRQLRQESMMAWNRLIYVVMPDSQTFPQVRNMLRSPIEKQLAANSDVSKSVGRTALASYVCLLYYSLRPTSSFETLDIYWDEYVSAMLVNFRNCDINHRIHLACSMLQNLFQSTEKWRESRVHEPAQIEMEELARLDPQWIRSRLPKVLAALETFLVCPQAWDSNEDAFDNVAVSTWNSLLESVREAGSKEVTSSGELKRSITAITNTLQRVGHSLKQIDSGVHRAQAYAFLAEQALTILGVSNFSEKFLLKLQSEENSFEVVLSQSHRLKSGALHSPITQIFTTLLQLSSDACLPLGTAMSYIQSLVQLCYSSMGSRNSRLKVLVDFSDALHCSGVVDDSSGINPALLEETTNTIWNFSCEAVMSTCDEATGHDCDAVLGITKNLMPFLKEHHMRKVLYTRALQIAKQIGGDGAVLLAVTEPHASMVQHAMENKSTQNSALLLSYAAMILQNDVRPRNRGAIERGRKALWGGISTAQHMLKNPDIEHNKLACLVDRTMQYGYENLSGQLQLESFQEFLDCLHNYILRTPTDSCLALINQAQSGLSRLLLDDTQNLEALADSVEGQRLLAVTLSIWTVISDMVFSRQHFYLDFEQLVLAGFKSRRKSIVNTTITSWNKSIDELESCSSETEFPLALTAAVKQIYRIADVRLPSAMSKRYATAEHIDGVNLSFSSYKENSPPLSKRPPTLQKRRSMSSMLKRPGSILQSRSPKKVATGKRRHDDSQVYFEPIGSSSVLQNSQYLTDRQKEIIERQREKSVTIFRDLHHDYVPKRNIAILDSTSSEAEDHSDVSRGSSDQEVPQSSPPTSPTIGYQAACDDVLQSSPPMEPREQDRKAGSSSLRIPAQPAIILSSPPESPTFQHNTLSRTTEDGVCTIEGGTNAENEYEAERHTFCNESPQNSIHTSDEAIGGIQDRVSENDLAGAQLKAEMEAQVDVQVLISCERDMPVDRTTDTHDKTASGDYPESDGRMDEQPSEQPTIIPQSDTQNSSDACLMPSSHETAYTPDSRIPLSKPTDLPVALAEKRKYCIKTRSTSSRDPLDDEPVRKKRKTAKRNAETIAPCINLASAESVIPDTNAVVSPEDGVAVQPTETVVATVRSQESQEIQDLPQPPITAQSIIAKLQDLVVDSSTLAWSKEEQLEIHEMAFQLQAVVRGYSSH